VRLPQKRNREMLGAADLMMGANHIRVRCSDGVTRLGRIKGKIKKRSGSAKGYPHHRALVLPGRKCGIIYRYTKPQVEWLKRDRYL
jgi:translation initiation factor 1A